MNLRFFFLFLLIGLSGLGLNIQTAHAGHGFLIFWKNPNLAQPLTHTKTTQENITLQQAQTEKNEFCQQQNQQIFENVQPNIQPNVQNGCFSEIHIENSCVAVAFSPKQGMISPDNLFYSIGQDIEIIEQSAIEQCSEKFGNHADCEIETIFCSERELYEPYSATQNTEQYEINMK